MQPVLPKLFAGALFAALAAAALSYPLNKMVLAAALAAYGALLWRRRHAWLMVVPALLPVLDLAPWTGWFFLDELDLLLLATTACGYARLRRDDLPAVLPPWFSWSLGLFTLSWLIAAWIGVTPLAPIDANAFANYTSHYNSLRTAKGLLWALILLPLLRRGAGADLAGLQRYLVPGMLLGLALACLAVVWERLLFPGLTNFASDYRPTATFSAMHTGGAALDAYLALAFPFVAAWLLGAPARTRLALALLLLLLGSYAGLALFSRDIYLAYGVSGAIIFGLLLARRARQGQLRGAGAAAATAALLLALAAFALARVFGSGGYRSLACALAVLAGAVLLAGAPGKLARIPLAAAGALGLCSLCALLAVLVDKGAYIGFALSAAVFAAATPMLLARRPQRAALGLALAAAALPAMAVGLLLVASHWGGTTAMADALLLAVLAGVVAAGRRMPQPFVRLDRGGLAATFACAIAFATVIPVASSYYAGQRFATVGEDLGVRLRHWREAIAMMDAGAPTTLLGMGLGRYPDTYMWNNTDGERPGTYRYDAEGGNRFLRLGAAHFAQGYGSDLRILQHVDVAAGKRYQLSADIRQLRGAGTITIALCARWMLYPQDCVVAPVRLGAAKGVWQHYQVEMQAGALGAAGLLAPPVQLEVSVEGSGAVVDVDNLSLREAGSGAEVLRNGAFSAANDYWFFSSDRNHFPWHVKNVAVNTFFEQGWFGVAALALLLVVGGAGLARRALGGETMAAVFLAALAGFLVIGAFDSLFDVPRLTLLFFLVACAAALRPATAAPRPGRRRVRRQTAAPAAPSQLPAEPVRQAEKSSNAP